MSQSMISFWVGLAVVLIVAFALVRRYRGEHPREGMVQWLDAHHMGWMHRKH
ncbi:conserved hypothetical protein [Paraburkholderia piptadeniae]|uniref:Uncharacterized protein n=1 Tax=Paraburkholderia piptadeniae TaxID=1701573 RepID=A0A1N7SVU8_9BURK|nr:hypothetical protein [Paraburkholderia piptadeniae]SIT51571.1 conserved hypothetical protein [Paraburkholderia piptadeniae]